MPALLALYFKLGGTRAPAKFFCEFAAVAIVGPFPVESRSIHQRRRFPKTIFRGIAEGKTPWFSKYSFHLSSHAVSQSPIWVFRIWLVGGPVCGFNTFLLCSNAVFCCAPATGGETPDPCRLRRANKILQQFSTPCRDWLTFTPSI